MMVSILMPQATAVKLAQAASRRRQPTHRYVMKRFGQVFQKKSEHGFP
ncbi:MAG: hypothetical protein Q4D37_01700 [Oscillospiraceae bacterium]|nr:hypothetical protein [Oscillospiraceae bacterium]